MQIEVDKKGKRNFKLGDEFVIADWVKTPGEIPMVADAIIDAFVNDAKMAGVIWTDIVFEVLPLSDPQVPKPPKDLPLDSALLTGSAKVARILPRHIANQKSILDDMTEADKLKLRQATQRAWRRTNPKERDLTRKELDGVIDKQSIELIEKTLGNA